MLSARTRPEVPFFLRAIRHHLLVVLGTTVAVVACAGLYFQVAHSGTYTAQATVLLSPVPGNPLSPESAATSGAQLNIAMQTEAAIVNTPQIARLVTDTVGEVLPRDGDDLLVVIPTGTQMVQISYTSSTPDQARVGAQAFADAYLTFRRTRADATQGARLRALEGQLEVWNGRLQEATAAAGDGDGFARQQVQIASARVAEINASLGAGDVVSTDPGSVTSPAVEPTSSDGLPLPLLLLGAGVAGAVWGCLLAMLTEWRRDLVREDEEAEIAGLPVFARVTMANWDDPSNDPRHASPDHEAYRRLRAGIVANTNRPCTLAVAAVGGGGDTPVVARSLAVTLHHAGFSVLLIVAGCQESDVDGSDESLAGDGIAEILIGARDWEDVAADIEGVTTIEGGNSQSVGDLYAGPGFPDLLKELKSHYDYIVVSSAGTDTADGDAVMAAADAVLLIVRSSQTTHAQVSAALDRFARLDISPIGIVNIPVRQDERASGTAQGASGVSVNDVTSDEAERLDGEDGLVTAGVIAHDDGGRSSTEPEADRTGRHRS